MEKMYIFWGGGGDSFFACKYGVPIILSNLGYRTTSMKIGQNICMPPCIIIMILMKQQYIELFYQKSIVSNIFYI